MNRHPRVKCMEPLALEQHGQDAFWCPGREIFQYRTCKDESIRKDRGACEKPYSGERSGLLSSGSSLSELTFPERRGQFSGKAARSGSEWRVASGESRSSSEWRVASGE